MQVRPVCCRRAVRATLILVPLFGLHLMVTMYRPTRGSCTWMEAYYYADYLLDGLQGAMVALIFCYLNGEVSSLNYSISFSLPLYLSPLPSAFLFLLLLLLHCE